MLDNLENKLIFLKHGHEINSHLEAVEELGQNIQSMQKLGVQLYQIDMQKNENVEAVLEYLKKRGSKLDKETIKTNSFMLTNNHNDVWF